LESSAEQAIESLLIFDARCLDRATQQELLLMLPALVHIRRAWKTYYLEYGCVSCHKKNRENTWYASGGFCVRCQGRIMGRMRKRYRKLMAGRDLTKELAAFQETIALRYNAAQRLFNGEDA
jgi:DNA-directed RNA polymerase subunit RPC12/RpoP